jgi:hypothetical protein
LCNIDCGVGARLGAAAFGTAPMLRVGSGLKRLDASRRAADAGHDLNKGYACRVGDAHDALRRTTDVLRRHLAKALR